MSRTRAVGAIVTLALVAASICGCVGSGPPVSRAVVTHTLGGPPSLTARIVADVAATKPFAAWAGPHQIYVVAWGSGSCPHLPTLVYADRHNDVTVDTAEQSFGADACTADLAPTTSTVSLPAGLDLSRPLRVRIDGTTTTLEAR